MSATLPKPSRDLARHELCHVVGDLEAGAVYSEVTLHPSGLVEVVARWDENNLPDGDGLLLGLVAGQLHAPEWLDLSDDEAILSHLPENERGRLLASAKERVGDKLLAISDTEVDVFRILLRDFGSLRVTWSVLDRIRTAVHEAAPA